MKKNFIQSLVLPVVLLFAVGCHKEFESSNQEQSKAAIALKAISAGGCRITSYDYYDGIGDFHNIDYYTYKNGLVDDVITFYGLRYNMEYNKQRKLIASRVYDGETLLYIITFVYEKNKVVQEIWRDAATQEIYDNVFLTYDKKGNLIRNESFIFDLYTTYTYTANRSLESWQVSVGGLPVAKAEYTYDDNYKNPFASLTGIDYLFWYANSGFGVGTGHRWYSSEKVTLYDENGSPFIYYEQDPAQTVWRVGQQHYPLKADYVDKSTHAQFINTFEYDCNPGQSSKAEGINQKMGTKHNSPVKRIKPYFMLPYKKAIEKHRGTKFH
jgi:hypothetical protein